ncbi:MAG: AraC family transcriptional regulator [Ferruginibacter sp.]
MEIHIKNMVCDRCKLKVSEILNKIGIKATNVSLGTAVLEEDIDEEQAKTLSEMLHMAGFEMIDSKINQLVDKIKTIMIELVHYSPEGSRLNLSEILSERLHYDYNYLSNIFSKAEHTTIEKYFIKQKIERVKELLEYDDKTLSMIADEMNYSSVAYLSNQFKKETGLTPTQYKTNKKNHRQALDKL